MDAYAEQFLSALLHDKPPDQYILLWENHAKTKDDKAPKVSLWFQGCNEAVKHVYNGGSKCNLYVGCGLSAKDLGQHRRARANEVSGIPGLWLDCDLDGPAHEKPNLPKTREEIDKLIASFPLKPTIIVNSGHGFQYWWVFDKFWLFGSEEDRQKAATLASRFMSYMRATAHSLGFDLDMVHDLSRVMRIPGSINHKPPVAPVTIESINCQYYSVQTVAAIVDQCISKIEPGLLEQKGTRPATVVPATGNVPFTLNSDAQPPTDKFDVLAANNENFLMSWNKQRRDFKDQSASSYDMSLATMAFAANWTIQEVVNLLIAFRREHNLDLKLRQDYYLRTVNVAMQGVKKDAALESLSYLAHTKPSSPADHKERIKQAVDSLSQIIGIRIIRILKYTVDPPEYRLIGQKTDSFDGEIHIGPIQHLIEQHYFRRKIADATGIFMRSVHKDRWPDVAQALLNACEIESTGAESSNKGLVESWLTMYLQHNEPMYDPQTAIVAHRPFFMKNSFFLFGIEFRKYVNQFCRDNIAQKGLGILLREYGFEPRQMNFKSDTKYISRYLWEMPIGADTTIDSSIDHALLNEANRQREEEQKLKDEERIAKEKKFDDY